MLTLVDKKPIILRVMDGFQTNHHTSSRKLIKDFFDFGSVLMILILLMVIEIKNYTNIC